MSVKVSVFWPMAYTDLWEELVTQGKVCTEWEVQLDEKVTEVERGTMKARSACEFSKDVISHQRTVSQILDTGSLPSSLLHSRITITRIFCKKSLSDAGI